MAAEIENSEVEQLENKIKELQKEIENNKVALENSQSEKETLEKKIEKLEKELDNLQKELEENKGDKEKVKELEQSIADKNAEIAQKDKDLNNIQNEKEQLAHQNTELNDSLNKKDEKIKELEEKLKDAEGTDVTELENQLDELKAEKETLENEKKKVESELAAKEKELQQAKEDKGNLQKQLAEKEGELAKVKENVEALQKQLDELEKKNQQLTKEKQALEDAAKADKETISEQEDKINKLQNQVTDLNKKIEGLQQNLDEETKEQLAQLQGEKDKLEQQVKNLQNEKETAKQTLQEKNNKIEKLEEQLEEQQALQEELKKAKKELEELKDVKQQLDEKTTQLEEKEKTLQQAKKELEKAQEDKQASDNKVKELEAEVEQLTAERDKVKGEKDTLQQQVNELTSANDSLNTQVKQLEQEKENLEQQLQQKKEELTNQAAEYEKAVKEFEDKIATLEKELQALKEQAESDKTKIENLQIQLDTANAEKDNLQSTLDALQGNMDAALKNAKETLNQAKEIATNYPNDAAIKAALDKAKALEDGATLADVQEVNKELLDAIKKAQENEAQKDEQQALKDAKEELDKLKDQAQDNDNDDVKNALDEAEKLSDNATLEELEKVIQDLQNALENAKNEEQEKNEQERLDQAKKSLDLAKGLAALYPEDEGVQNALTEAEELDENATVEELNKATDQLLSAINEAEKNKQLQSKNELLKAIETAKNQAESYTDDEEVNKALEKAQAASNDNSMKELHDILDELRTATEAAQKKKEQAAKDAEKEKALKALHDAADLLAEYADDQKVLDALENVAELDENSSLEDINAKKDELLDLLAKAVKQSKLATDEQKTSTNDAIEELEQLLENEFLAPSVKPSEDTINEWKEQLKKDELLLADYEKVVNEVEQAKNEVTDNIATNEENYNEAKTAVDGAKELAEKLNAEEDDKRITELFVGLLEEIGIAKSAIDRMTDELPHKAKLENKLGEVVANISDKAVDYVDGNLTPELLEQAKDLVDLMPEGEKKENLKDKLQQLEKIVDQVNEVLEALNNAQKNPSDETIQDAQNKIDALEKLDTKYVTEEDIKALQNQLDLVKVAHEKEQMADELNDAKDLLLTTPVGEDGKNFFDTEVYVTEEEKNALQDALQKVENAHTKDALDEAKNALENALKPYKDEKKYGERNEAVEQATAAVKKAETSKRQADVDEARKLVNEINEKTHQDEKEDLNNRLKKIEVEDITLGKLREVLKQAEDAKEQNKSQKEEYPKGVWDALEKAISQGDSVVKAAGDTAEETMTSDDITNATEALEKALEDLVIPVQLPSQTMINKAEFNLEPIIKLESERLSDSDYKAKYHKTTGGLLSLNLGIVDLGLLSAGQINKISDKDKHEIKVEPNTVFTGKVRVSMSGVLGGQQVKVHTYKELPNGDYKKIATRAGGVGTLLGIPIPTYIDVGMLEEGNYILLLEPSAGISLAAGIPFDIREAMIYDYSQSADKAEVTGNFFEKEGATKGQDSEASIIEAVTGGIHENLTHPLAINGETEIQGKYGKLYVKRDGTYRYAPESKRQNIGQYEEFKIHAKNTKNGTSDEGTLRILLDHDTIEWADNNKESKIVEAADDKKETTIQVNPVKNVVTAAPSDQRTSRVEDHTFRSNEFTVQDTDSELSFELSKSGKENMEMDVKVVNVDTGEVAHEWKKSVINNDWNESPDYRVTGLPKGTYRVKAKASIEGNTPRVYIQNIEVVSTSWGEYSLPYSGAKEVSGNLRTLEGNYLGADEEQHDKTLLYVKGYDVTVDDALRYLTFEVDDRGHFIRDKKGDIAKHVDRVLHKGEVSDNAMYLQSGDVKAFKRIETNIRNKRDSELTVLAGDYGVLEIETNGNYTYKPYNRIESVGQTEVFEYMLVHPSGNTATAKLEIKIGELDQSTDNNDLILKQQQQVEFTTGKGSDTLIYQVFDDEDNLAGHEHSTWVDFTYGGVDTVEDADRIDLRAMFKAEDLNEKTVANYVKVKHEDDGITIQIDRDGLGQAYETADLITLKGDFDKNITINDLIKNGQILLP